MGKSASVYICQQCGYESSKWLGKCPNCGEWNSLVETSVSSSNFSAKGGLSQFSKKNAVMPIKLSSIKLSDNKRKSTGIPEFDRVLGGGLVPGQVVLLAGEPGVGKSTLLLQMAGKLQDVIYVAGEESPGQIQIRAKRLGISGDRILVLPETNVETIINSVQALLSNKSKVSAIVIDSIQTMNTSDLRGMSGSIGQVREVASRLTGFAKQNGIPVIIVGHVTKQGGVAGPSTLMHIVDTVAQRLLLLNQYIVSDKFQLHLLNLQLKINI